MDQGDAVPIAELWEERRFLLDVAHWMLGAPGAAESAVDEAYRQWYGLSDAARRQIVAELADRARRWLRVQRSRPTTPQQQDAVAHAVRRACVTEDREWLASLLCSDVTAFFDGGGKVRALTGPVHGSRRVADSLLTLLANRPRTTLTTRSVNGRTGLLVRYGRQVAAVISLDVADGRVAQVWVMLNPDKLRSWNPSHPA